MHAALLVLLVYIITVILQADIMTFFKQTERVFDEF
jgi:hypothetical protein